MSELAKLPSIETVDGCDPQHIPGEVFESDVPLVLKGLVSKWPAVKACSQSLAQATEYLSDYWVEKPVTVYVGESDIKGRFGYNDDFTDFNFKSGYGQLAQVLQKLSEEPDDETAMAIYVGSTAVDGWLRNPDTARAAGNRGREVVEANRGATVRTVDALLELARWEGH